MLKDNEVTFMEFVKNNPDAIATKIEKRHKDLEKRGYIRISRALNIFGANTGFYKIEITEAGKIAMKHQR